MKRKIGIVLLVISLIMLLLGVYIAHKKGSDNNNTTTNRDKYVKEFSEKGRVPTDGPNDVASVDTSGMDIENNTSLAKCITVDDTLLVTDQLLNQLYNLNEMANELKNADDSKTITYYNNSQNTIMNLYGIHELESFKKLLQVGKTKQIVIVKIDEKSIYKTVDGVEFDLIINTSLCHIAVKKNKVNNETIFSIVWVIK